MPDLFKDLVESWRIHLRAQRRSERTIEQYRKRIRSFANWLAEEGITDPVRVTRRDVEMYLAKSVTTEAANTTRSRWVALRSFYGWLVDVEEMDVSPVAKVKAPVVVEQPVDLITEDQARALLDTTKGKGFDQRRDAALLRLMLDTGLRVSEAIGMTLDDIDFTKAVVHVREAKGGKERFAPLGAKTLEALDAYRRARARHRHADSPAFWLGTKGPFTTNGVRLMVRRRGEQAGIEGLHPHQLRHAFADFWLRNGGTEGSLMQIGGWQNPAVMRRYGSAAAVERAHREHRDRSPGDRL